MRLLLSGFLVLLGILAAQSQPVRAAEPKLDCKDPPIQMIANACAGQAFDKADKELNQLWKRVVADAKARGADLADLIKQDGVPTPLEALRSAQRAWIAYRDAECSYEPYSAFGTMRQPEVGTVCKTRMTRARIAELKATLSQQ